MASVYQKKNKDGKKSGKWYYCISYQGKKVEQGCTGTEDYKSAVLIAKGIETDIARERNELPALGTFSCNF